MRTIRHLSPARFLETTSDFLRAREALNNLFFGVAGDAANGRYADGDNLWLSAHEGDRVVGAAFQTPPYELSLAYGSSPDAVVALAREASAQRRDALDGVRAPAEFVVAIEAEFGRTYTRLEELGIYELTRVVPPSSVAGSMRSAVKSDLDRLTSFAIGFSNDTGAVRSERDALHARVATLIGSDAFVVWDIDGQLVSMAAVRGPTPRGIRISWVYTPHELRGRGYASALVAQLSQRELDGGRQFCFLFNDLTNPTSNRVYQRVGYRQVGEMGTFRVVRE